MLRRLFCSGLAALLALLLPTVGAVSVGAAVPTGAVVATGVLTDKVGHGAPGRVYALAWPGEDLLRTLKPGDTINTPTVGLTDADATGRFSLAVKGAAVPSTHLRRDGGLNLLIVATDGSNEAMLFQPAEAPSRLNSLASRAAATRVPAITLTMNRALSPTTKSLAVAASRSKASSMVTPNAPPPPATYPCHGWSLESSSLVWVSMGQSYSGPAKNFAVLEQSSSITNGGAVSITGAFGSWSSSGAQTLTTGNTKTWTESLADRDFQSEFQYGKWKTLCQGGQRYAFTPSFGTGGDREPSATNYPARNKCSSISPGLWSRNSSTGSAYSESVGVKASSILGINLGVTHNYNNSSSTKFTLNYRNTTTVTICGDTNFPSLASKPRI
jgi:hypothetical protein